MNDLAVLVASLVCVALIAILVLAMFGQAWRDEDPLD